MGGVAEVEGQAQLLPFCLCTVLSLVGPSSCIFLLDLDSIL